jgi:hypothetical protein
LLDKGYRAREYGIKEDYRDGVGTYAKGGCKKVFVPYRQTIY